MALPEDGLTQIYKTMFSRNHFAVAQQRKRRLLNTYTPEQIVGNGKWLQVAEPRELQERVLMAADTPIKNQTWYRRELTIRMADDGALYDTDFTKILADIANPQSDMIIESVNAANRWQDRLQIEALLNSPWQQVGATTEDKVRVPLPASQKVNPTLGGTGYNVDPSAGVFANLTLQKIVALHSILARTDDDSIIEGGDETFLLVTSDMMNALLGGEAHVDNSLYVGEQYPLLTAKLRKLYSFTFIISNQLNRYAVQASDSVGTKRLVPVIGWSKRAIVGDSTDLGPKIDQIPEKSYAVQVYNRAQGGFLRLKDNLVSLTYCDPKAPVNGTLPI